MGSSRRVSDEKLLRVRRGRVDSVDLYEIKDSELDLLERGSPAGLQLNFAIFLLSTAFSAIVSLATATFASDTVKTVFIVVAVVGMVIGAYLLISWWHTRASISCLVRIIRGRIEDDSGVAAGPTSPTSGIVPSKEEEPVG